MASTLLLALLIVAAPLPVREAQEPSGPPPTIVMLKFDRDGSPVITQARMVPVIVRKPVTEQVDGKPVTRLVTVTEYRVVREICKYTGDGCGIYTLDGKKVEIEDARKIITEPTPVVLSADSNPVDPIYLRLAKASTLVVVIPRAGKEGASPAPAIPPAPRPE